MPIPTLNSDGILPSGIHDCSLAEIERMFGEFQQSDQRPRLFHRLRELVVQAKNSGLFECLIVDGSFVTRKSGPNDIDLIAVLKRGHDFESELPMARYAVVSRALLNRRYGFDVIVAERDSELYKTFVEYFSRVRDFPQKRKGLLRIAL